MKKMDNNVLYCCQGRKQKEKERMQSEDKMNLRDISPQNVYVYYMYECMFKYKMYRFIVSELFYAVYVYISTYVHIY